MEGLVTKRAEVGGETGGGRREEQGGAEILWVEFSAATLWVPLLFLLVFLRDPGGREERRRIGWAGWGSERWRKKGKERREEGN